MGRREDEVGRVGGGGWCMQCPSCEPTSLAERNGTSRREPLAPAARRRFVNNPVRKVAPEPSSHVAVARSRFGGNKRSGDAGKGWGRKVGHTAASPPTTKELGQCLQLSTYPSTLVKAHTAIVQHRPHIVRYFSLSSTQSAFRLTRHFRSRTSTADVRAQLAFQVP
jgi:hypothetical protein